MSLSVSPADFKAWVEAAPVGSDIVYHEGPDLYDDMHINQLPIAKTVMEQAEQGLVFLYQRRLSEHTRQYRAKRISGEAGKVLRPSTKDEQKEWR